MNIEIDSIKITDDQFKAILNVEGKLRYAFDGDLQTTIKNEATRKLAEKVFEEYSRIHYQDILNSISKDAVMSQVLMLMSHRMAGLKRVNH